MKVFLAHMRNINYTYVHVNIIRPRKVFFFKVQHKLLCFSQNHFLCCAMQFRSVPFSPSKPCKYWFRQSLKHWSCILTIQGSTCALVDSILRNLNVKTGFYSSPHLLNVTERIRLNGEPISKAQFSQYFWKIYNILEETKVSLMFICS